MNDAVVAEVVGLAAAVCAFMAEDEDAKRRYACNDAQCSFSAVQLHFEEAGGDHCLYSAVNSTKTW